MTTDRSGLFIPAPASLDNPLYYLLNARQVIDWCLLHYRDLLLEEEIRLLETFLDLPNPAQGLLIRLIMRKGDLFRDDSLNYPEVGHDRELTIALEQLQATTLIHLNPSVSLPELTHLCRKPEALSLLKTCHGRYPLLERAPAAKHSKLQLIGFAEHLSDRLPEENTRQPLHLWWPQAPFRLIELHCSPLFERLRLMFFGNLYQSWSEFVLAELGIQTYETVDLSPQSRAFTQREMVDIYLTLYRVQQDIERIKGCHESSGWDVALTDLEDQLEQLVTEYPEYLSDTATQRSDWLVRRYQKTCFQLGHFAERSGLSDLALSCYRRSQGDDAVIRRLRLMEKQSDCDADFQLLYEDAMSALNSTQKPEQQLLIQRILKRVGRKLNQAASCTIKPAKPVKLNEITLTLSPDSHRPVEPVLVDYLAEQGEIAFHVESRLINGLFSLLFWPALFKPTPGAFFNPFQSGPADLYRDDFYTKRQALMDEILTRLRDSNGYKSEILNRYQQKKGISCSLVHWPALNEELLQLSLEFIPAQHLYVLFRHLLLDLRHHRKGLPDLVVFNPETSSYRFVEVKAPNDRLQDHQRLWLENMQREGIPAEVVYVRWRDS